MFSGTFALPGTLSVFFLSPLSSLTMWWQLYCFQTRRSTAISSPGTGWCCFMVKHYSFVWQDKLRETRLLLVPLSSCEELQLLFSGGAGVVLECPPLWSQSGSCSRGFGYLTLRLAATWLCLVTFYTIIKLFKYLPHFPIDHGLLRIAVALCFFIVSLELPLMGNELQTPHFTGLWLVLGGEYWVFFLNVPVEKRIERKPQLQWSRNYN